MSWWGKIFGPSSNSKSRGYPAGFDAVPEDGRIKHPEEFDPALTHFMNGFRKGEPTFKDPGDEVAWYAIRDRVIHHLLKVFAATDIRNSLIVRGSVLMQQWFGKQARKPRDIDWVINPQSQSMQHPDSKQLMQRICELIKQNNQLHNVQLNIDRITMDDIWTYDRAPGRRIVIPWTSENVPPGFVQMDFVFEEELWCEPIEVGFPGFEQGTTLLAASPEQSLAWKLLWLSTDIHAEGKDLYDAVLLAESYPIDRKLLATAYSDNGRLDVGKVRLDLPRGWDFDWKEFQQKYPKIEGSEEEWKSRLVEALKPAFDS